MAPITTIIKINRKEYHRGHLSYLIENYIKVSLDEDLIFYFFSFGIYFFAFYEKNIIHSKNDSYNYAGRIQDRNQIWRENSTSKSQSCNLDYKVLAICIMMIPEQQPTKG